MKQTFPVLQGLGSGKFAFFPSTDSDAERKSHKCHLELGVAPKERAQEEAKVWTFVLQCARQRLTW